MLIAYKLWFKSVTGQLGKHPGQFSSVAQSCPPLCDPMDRSTPGFLSITNSRILLKLMSNHRILCCPLLLPPLIFPSIRVFSNESVLRIKWPKYWSFSFSISPSSEYSGLISFRMDWLWMKLEPIIQSEVSQKEKHQYSILTHIYGI